MSRRFTRRYFLSAVAGLALATPACARPPTESLRPVARGADALRDSQPPIDVLLKDAGLGGAVGFAVADARTGKLHETHNAAQGLPPASVAKALTAGYALATLGPEHRFETRVIATGPVRDGVVQGDLVLVGGGDPTLNTDDLVALAQAVVAKGVTQITGAFQVWGGALPYEPGIDTSQPDHVGYNPAVSGLNLNFNRVHFEWRPSGGAYTVSMDARSASHKPTVRMARMAVADRSTPVYTYKDMGQHDSWTVARGALGKGGARWLPVRKPELYAGEVFQSLAAAYGLRLPAPKVVTKLSQGTVLARHTSDPLDKILRDMLRFSTNITAEAVGMAATAARTGARPQSLRASAREMNRWAREALGVPSVSLVDHSGLGDKSRVSATHMMAALRALRMQAVRMPDTALKSLLKDFPMRDSQRRVIENHPIKVSAKTGTLNFVSGLAGFVDLPDGTELVFAIFTADMDRRAGLSKAERERPKGGRTWNRRAKTLQQTLIERWGVLYSA